MKPLRPTFSTAILCALDHVSGSLRAVFHQDRHLDVVTFMEVRVPELPASPIRAAWGRVGYMLASVIPQAPTRRERD